MESLQNRFDSFFPVEPESMNWEGLATFVSLLQVEVSIWGHRYVSSGLRVDGVDETVPLAVIVNKIYKAAKTACLFSLLSKENRLHGLQIVDRLAFFYRSSDELIARKPFFERLVTRGATCLLRDDARFLVEHRIEELFCSYSEASFKSTYGSTRKSVGSYWLNEHVPMYIASRAMISRSMPLLTV